jgi:hypothetical protein
MPSINIKPQTVLLTSGQAVTFEATNGAGQSVAVSWSLSPQVGNLVSPASGSVVPPGAATATQALSATYIAPLLVSSAQTTAVIASTANDSASATISLTPDAITIVPAKTDLNADQSQQFIAIVAGAPSPTEAAKITWILSSPLGSLEQTGLYKAPPETPEPATVNVIASSPTLGRQAVATVNLVSPPWQGLGVNILGGFLLLVFSLVFLMVGLWPPALPSPDAAKASRIEAEKTLEDKTATLQNLEVVAAKSLEEKRTALAKSNQVPLGGAPGSKAEENAANLEAANAKAAPAEYALQRAKETRDFAAKDLDKKRVVEETVNDPGVDTRLAHHINRELDLLWLVLLAGCLGSFLHTAQSYTEYIGNRTIKSSWTWWYCFRPFIGAGLALVFYAAIRGGFMAVATGSNAKASELNPFGLVAIGALVGMFSKAATLKLGEVFDTLFKSDKAKESKDKLVPTSQISSQSEGKAATGGSEGSTAKK